MAKIVKNSLGNFLVVLVIFALVTGWFFSGWPRIWQNPAVPPLTQVAYAFTSGPNNTGTDGTAEVGACANNVNWGTTGQTPVYASGNDTNYVTISGNNFDSGEYTDQLRLSNFGFSITGTVTGITVEVLGWGYNGTSPSNYNTVQLFTTPGSAVGDNKATGELPSSDPTGTYQSFGGTTDTWNAGLTAAQVSNSGFGVALCFIADAADSRINIDHVRITITYSNSAPTLNIDQPDGSGDSVVQGQTYNIQYDLGDSDNSVTAAFYYDTDTDMSGGTAISGTCASAGEGTDQTCGWDTTGVTAGDYWIYGVTNDGVNSAVNDLSPGQATVVVQTVSCDADPASVSFPTLTISAVETATGGLGNNASTTMSCTYSGGCALSVSSAGNTSFPGLATTSPAYLIQSVTETLNAGAEEGYGLQATTTSAGSGGALTISTAFNKTDNDVGAMGTSGVVAEVASSTTTFTNREVLITHKAAIVPLTTAGNYEDTITYSCAGNP